MKVEITTEIDVEEMLRASNETLKKMFDDQIDGGFMKSVILATIDQNEHLLKMMKNGVLPNPTA
jgi:hypothetical protein